MNCKEAIEYIHSLERFGIRPGLERIGELCSVLGNPQNKCKYVHVAGTNGKGSTSSMIAHALSAGGFVTGLYTSPYVIDFRERIQLDGKMIEPRDLACAVEKVKSASEEHGIILTEFEAVTAAAFVYYASKNCDYVVLETGLGGRFDATNIIPAPAVSVITSISLDHMNVLGDTIEQIAFEKCGIIKAGSRVVTYPYQNSEALSVIEKTCREKSVPLILPDAGKAEVTDSDFRGSTVKYRDFVYRLSLPGIHMVYNSLMALEALTALETGIDSGVIARAFSETRMPARTEVISQSPCVILDGGHNEDCAAALKNYIQTYLSGRKLIIVSSLMADKDYETYLRLIAPLGSLFIATQAGVSRALPAGELKKCASRYCPECLCIDNPVSAVQKALAAAGNDDIVIICGSFYLAGDVRELFVKDDGK